MRCATTLLFVTLPAGAADARFSEAERFEAAKAHKAELTKGVSLFNVHPIKGMAALQRSGVAGSTPQQVRGGSDHTCACRACCSVHKVALLTHF